MFPPGCCQNHSSSERSCSKRNTDSGGAVESRGSNSHLSCSHVNSVQMISWTISPGWLQGRPTPAGTSVQMPIWNASGASSGRAPPRQSRNEPHQWMSVTGSSVSQYQSSATICSPP